MNGTLLRNLLAMEKICFNPLIIASMNGTVDDGTYETAVDAVSIRLSSRQ